LEEESRLALDVLEPVYGDVVVDMSCGSGLFSRKFIESGKFKRVIAADYSETMVQEAKSNFEKARLDPAKDYLLLRADVCRLPFATGSVPAIHAGAAIHCWPDPLGAMAEISRVLRPGGIFVGTTFLSAVSPLGELVGDDVIRPVRSVLDQSPLGSSNNSNLRWWNEDELRDLSETVGLQKFTAVVRKFRFIMFSAIKPPV
jgi:ubiquinone/menaquinone biosynthesis C-methylase UbiE